MGNSEGQVKEHPIETFSKLKEPIQITNDDVPNLIVSLNRYDTLFRSY
jgi:hypothetical protein